MRNAAKITGKHVGTIIVGALAAAVAAPACGGEPAAAPDEAAAAVSPVQQALEAPTGVRLNFVKTADWGTGYNARIDVTNFGPASVLGWQAVLDMPANLEVTVGLPAAAWRVGSGLPPAANVLRIDQSAPSNVIAVGQTVSVYLWGAYQGAFGFPVRCRAPLPTTPVACDGSADLVAPSPPANVRVVAAGVSSVEVAWDPATDDAGVTGYALLGTSNFSDLVEIGEVPGTHAIVTGLASQAQAVSILVAARDAAGNLSTSIGSPPTPTRAPLMSAAFTTTNTWPGGGFQGQIAVTSNETTTTLERWRVLFSFTGSFSSVAGADLSSPSAGAFQLAAPAYDLTLAPGETTIVGVVGTFGTPSTPPTGFTFATAAGTLIAFP